jgi:hypothetical protein
MRHRAAALGEALAIRPDIDIPQLDFIWRRGAPEVISIGGKGKQSHRNDP